MEEWKETLVKNTMNSKMVCLNYPMIYILVLDRPIQVVDTSDGAAPERTADGVVVISLYPTHGLQHHSEYHETSKQRASKAEEVPLRSPELESRLPSCPPDPVSQQFLLFMDWNRLYNRESHFRVLHSAVKLLKRTYSNGKHLFALDHCKSKRNH